MGLVVLATAKVLVLELLTLAGVLLVFASLLRWHWVDIRQDWSTNRSGEDGRRCTD